MRTDKVWQSLYRFDLDTVYKSGRIRTTVSLAPLALKSYQTAAGTPSDTPAGNTFLCARIRSGEPIAESVETTILHRLPILAIQ